jgi:prevent-host-death family protein
MTARTSIWLAGKPYGPYTSAMPKKSYGAEEARTLLPELIERAHRGEHSVITKRGKPYAEVVPVGSSTNGKPRLSFLSLAGTGHGLWGHDSRKTLKRLRDEWR